MAGVGIDGLVSGFQTSTVVSQLIELERKPLTLLESKKTTLNTELNAWREMNTRLYALKDAAYELQNLGMFRGRKITVSDETVFTATGLDSAVTANYHIFVESLAKTHSVSSDAQTSAVQGLGLEGTVQINGEDINITADDSLNSIAQKINNRAGLGVNASVIQVGEDSFKLTLTSKETGTANAVTFTDGGAGDGVLTELGLLDISDQIKHETQAATDAHIKVNGLDIFRGSNSIDDAIQNVTLQLKKEGGGADLNVEVDKDKVVDAVKDFIDKYNSLMTYINKNTAYDPKSKTAGPLFGESALMYLQSQIRGYLHTMVEGVPAEVGALTMLGIETASGIEGAKSGLLEFDEEKFRAKLDTDFDQIGKFFGATSEVSSKGIFTRIHDELYEMTSTNGLLKTKTSSIDAQIDDLDDQIESMELRLKKKEEQLYARFNAMELALMKLQNQEKWIMSQIAGLNANWRNS